MKTLLPLLLLFTGLGPAVGQNWTYRVVAKDGLRLRETPDRNGRVLAVAPFWDSVEVEARAEANQFGIELTGEFRQDTMGVAYVGLFENSQDYLVPDTVKLIGQWLPVQYKGQRGFMFSGFLGPDFGGKTKRHDPDDRFRLRNSQGNCCSQNDPEVGRDWHWHGLFWSGKDWEVRPVTLRYLALRNRILTLTEDPVQPIWVFGAKRSWPRHRLSNFADSLQHRLHFFSDSLDIVKELQVCHRHGMNFEKVGDGANYLKWAAICPDGQYQWLPMRQDSVYYLEDINWIGDFDGDTRPDYLASDSEFGACLFLSSAAKTGDAVGFAARLFEGGCE